MNTLVNLPIKKHLSDWQRRSLFGLYPRIFFPILEFFDFEYQHHYLHFLIIIEDLIGRRFRSWDMAALVVHLLDWV